MLKSVCRTAWRALLAGAGVLLLETCASASALPDNRSYELVTPPQKNGGDIVADSQRTRAAADGNALSFVSLSGFGDVHGTGIATEYVSERSSQSAPGDNGWTTHGITPLQATVPFPALLSGMEPFYSGEFSRDLNTGVFLAYSALTPDPGVAAVPNLYVRTDLLSEGSGRYALVSACPLCNLAGTPLPPLPPRFPGSLLPFLAWASPDYTHVAFESLRNLTPEAPAQPASCDVTTGQTDWCRGRVYEWDNGVTRLAGILPDGTSADVSIAGHGAGSTHSVTRPVHTVSDGSDGHSRIFFTQPTDDVGNTSSQLPDESAEQAAVNTSSSGNVFMRVDHSLTEQLNVSERGGRAAYAPAMFLDASADGTRAFFMTSEALTDDASEGGAQKLYMYDASKPASDPHNLTLIAPTVDGLIGISDDGEDVYMVSHGQLVRNGPALTEAGIFLWHDGVISYIGPSPTSSAETEELGSGGELFPQQSRVTPDGRHMLFSAQSGTGLTGYDHGACQTTFGLGCRELYVYSADSSTPLQPDIACASCNPTGARATQMASSIVRENTGGTQASWHLNHALSDDGRYVFFSTSEALLPEDTNGRSDAYEYDVATRAVHLLSSGTDASDSWFLDASADGRDAFFITRERLVGWDADGGYDVYDARIAGGFPGPRSADSCGGDACRGAISRPPPAQVFGTATFHGGGDVRQKLTSRVTRCRKGFARKRARGRVRCVKKARRHKRHRRLASQRRGS